MKLHGQSTARTCSFFSVAEGGSLSGGRQGENERHSVARQQIPTESSSTPAKLNRGTGSSGGYKQKEKLEGERERRSGVIDKGPNKFLILFSLDLFVWSGFNSLAKSGQG